MCAPRGQAQFLELRKLAEAEARGDVASGVVTDAELGVESLAGEPSLTG
jgi:hypothetical protein